MLEKGQLVKQPLPFFYMYFKSAAFLTQVYSICWEGQSCLFKRRFLPLTRTLGGSTKLLLQAKVKQFLTNHQSLLPPPTWDWALISNISPASLSSGRSVLLYLYLSLRKTDDFFQMKKLKDVFQELHLGKEHLHCFITQWVPLTSPLFIQITVPI